MSVIHVRVNPAQPRPICTEITEALHCQEEAICTIFGFKDEPDARLFAREVKRLKTKRVGVAGWRDKLKQLFTNVEKVRQRWEYPIFVMF